MTLKLKNPDFVTEKADSIPKSSPDAEVLVVILNWNGEADTIEALDSVRGLHYANFKTLVVDNGSRPESREAIRRAFPETEIVETGENLGYAAGNNVGLRLALDRDADYCLILNNDVTVDPSMLDILVREAQSDASLAIIGPRVYRYDRPDALFYTGWKIDWKRWLFHRVPAEEPTGPLLDVDYVQGCAMLVRCSFLRENGLFDERYHLYCEDADFCVRAQRAGFRTVEVVGAKLWHKGYGSSGQGSDLKAYYGLRNRLLFITLHAPRPNRLLLRAQLLFFDMGGQILSALGNIFKGDFRRGARRIRALTTALLHAATGHYGPGPGWLFRRKKENDTD